MTAEAPEKAGGEEEVPSLIPLPRSSLPPEL